MAQRQAEDTIRKNDVTIAQQEQTIEELADKIKQLENELQQSYVVNSDKNGMIESVLALILQDFITTHGFSNDERRAFIDKLKGKIGNDLSPTIEKMLHDLEASLVSVGQISAKTVSAYQSVVDSFASVVPNPPSLQRSGSNDSARLPFPVTTYARRSISPREFFHREARGSDESLDSTSTNEGVRRRRSFVSGDVENKERRSPKNDG